MVETFDCPNTTLKKGSEGAKVTLLQTHLKTLGYYTTFNGSTLKIDGIFGTYTEWAVKKFQEATGHTSDGVFGPKTCPDLNKKILSHYGISNNNTTTSNNTNNNTNKVTTTSTPAQTDPYYIFTRNNVYSVQESNFHIQGLHFIASKITRTNEFGSPDWKTIELMSGKDYEYLGRKQAKQYSVEIYMTNDKYNIVKSELEKLQYIFPRVASDLIPSGYYKVKVKVDDEGVIEKKITLELTEKRS